MEEVAQREIKKKETNSTPWESSRTRERSGGYNYNVIGQIK